MQSGPHARRFHSPPRSGIGTSIAALLIAGLALGRPTVARADSPKASGKLVCDRIVDDFRKSTVGAFPLGWRTKDDDDMPLAKQNQLYVVEKDANRNVLRARSRDKAITIGKNIKGWDLDAYPVLRWEWKAIELPKGGNEDSLSSNDCAASVYTFWDIGFPFYVDSVKYTWSSSLKLGTELKKRLGHDHVRVMASGTQALGKWRTVVVDVRADYLRLFGKEKPSSPTGIAVLTDADATESTAEAYYADFRLCRYQT
jgi:hypothetical protein